MATKTAHYNVNGKAGLVRTSKSRTTGTTIEIWYSPETKSIKTNEDKPFTTKCVDHGKSKEFATRVEAGAARLDPTTFCATCKSGAGKASKAAPAKKATAAKKASPKKAA